MKKGIKKKVQYRNQKGKSKGSAIALAIVLSQWTWVYTYREDAWKFWVGLISSMFLFWTLIVPLGIWIWAIVDVCEKDQEWYKQYND
ncbi:hypothetical protein HOE52_03970 [Candidatus Woesearchaeota archaeon]|nr:hypothetical protein [Candidatus Woesearchaeota archaeon]